MKKNRLNHKFYLFIIGFVLSLLAVSCLNLRSCNKDVIGRYYCYNNEKATNYLDLNKDGTFFHFYKEGDLELSHSGTWQKSDNGYCQIEFSEWNSYNRQGLNFKEYGNGILFINGDYLDISPDGESSTSFIKE